MNDDNNIELCDKIEFTATAERLDRFFDWINWNESNIVGAHFCGK